MKPDNVRSPRPGRTISAFKNERNRRENRIWIL
jgi:hypothetical protein